MAELPSCYPAAKMFHILKMNPAVYGRKLQGFPTAPQCQISRSDVVWSLTAIDHGVRQPKSHDCQKKIRYCMRERTSADVCLRECPGYYLKQMLAIKSCCTVSQTIPVSLTAKCGFLLCSRWVNIPTLTWKTKLASILSISCNIWHLTQQQSQGKLQGLMLWKRTFRHFWWANIVNRQSTPHNDVIKRMKARAAWTQGMSEPWGHCTTCNPKRSLRPRNDEKRTS